MTMKRTRSLWTIGEESIKVSTPEEHRRHLIRQKRKSAPPANPPEYNLSDDYYNYSEEDTDAEAPTTPIKPITPISVRSNCVQCSTPHSDTYSPHLPNGIPHKSPFSNFSSLTTPTSQPYYPTQRKKYDVEVGHIGCLRQARPLLVRRSLSAPVRTMEERLSSGSGRVNPAFEGDEFLEKGSPRHSIQRFGSGGSLPINNGYIGQDAYDENTKTELGLGERRSSQSIISIPSTLMRKKNRLSTLATSRISQNFTEKAKEAIQNYSSVNYSTNHSIAYMKWLREKGISRTGFQWDRWFLTFLIGVLTGLIAVLLNQCLQALGKVKWSKTQEYADEGNTLKSWGWTAGISCVFVLISSVLVAFVHPPAAGGGTPEVIAYLNGVLVHGVFGLKNLVVKFISTVFAVSSGLPCAIQGPIISYGAIIGKGIGQFRSATCKYNPKVFTRFYNAEDRRSFTTVGVAAGVAAAFDAPIGGLLFAMEDLSSFWSKQLSWHVFFGSVIATGVAGLFNSAFTGFQFGGLFGLFTITLVRPIQIHVALLCLSIVIGILGGLFGSIFTLTNTQVVAKARKLVLSKVKAASFGFKSLRVFETIILALIMATYTSILPIAFDCQNYSELGVNSSRISTICSSYMVNSNSTTVAEPPIKLISFHCPMPAENNNSDTDIYYNELATIIQNGGTAQLNILWSRDTHYFFRWYIPLVLLAVWLPMTIWTIGSSIAGGIFVPVLIIGALYGRAVGSGMMHLYETIAGQPLPTENEWMWIDPGIMAVLGSAGMLGGVTRLAIATTVIMVEMSHDVNLVIPILISVMTAKSVADALCKPLYKYQLDAKSLPYLDQEPTVLVDGHIVNLELHKAEDVMSTDIKCIKAVESLYHLSHTLEDTKHEGFPVAKLDKDTHKDVCYGLITRSDLLVVLCNEKVYDMKTPHTVIELEVDYEELSQDYHSDESTRMERIKSYGKFDVYKTIFVNLDNFINISAPKVDRDFSLLRTYNLVRTLGLRHLIIIDIKNQPVGMITRKDLMPFRIQDRLSSLDVRSLQCTPRIGQNALNTISRGSTTWNGPPPLNLVEPISEEDEEELSDYIELPATTKQYRKRSSIDMSDDGEGIHKRKVSLKNSDDITRLNKRRGSIKDDPLPLANIENIKPSLGKDESDENDDDDDDTILPAITKHISTINNNQSNKRGVVHIDIPSLKSSSSASSSILDNAEVSVGGGSPIVGYTQL